jgi:hypothetical protein
MSSLLFSPNIYWKNFISIGKISSGFAPGFSFLPD